MSKPSVLARVRTRVPGIPRTGREMLTSLQALSTLRAEGWHRSVAGGPPAGPEGAARPWLTYAAMRWLSAATGPQQRVFEYGSGSSTRWFTESLTVREIVSVEHDPDWHAQLPQPPQGRILLIPCAGTWWEAAEDSPYVRAVASGAPWDVIVIDGMARTTCARQAVHHLTPTGIVVLDDTDRATTRPAEAALTAQGLGRLDLWGFKPGLGVNACTSVFGRDFNPWMRRAAAVRATG
jgi:hypothetical protein